MNICATTSVMLRKHWYYQFRLYPRFGMDFGQLLGLRQLQRMYFLRTVVFTKSTMRMTTLLARGVTALHLLSEYCVTSLKVTLLLFGQRMVIVDRYGLHVRNMIRIATPRGLTVF
jgi:hypothetical protein